MSRIAAALIDGVGMTASAVLAAGFFFIFVRGAAWCLVALVAVFALLYAACEIPFTSSIGKRLMKLEIFPMTGASSWQRRALRWTVKWAPLTWWFSILIVITTGVIHRRHEDWLLDSAIILPIVVVAAHVTAAVLDREHRALHDRIAGTEVCQRLPASRLRAFEPVLLNDQRTTNAASALPSPDRDV